MSDAAHRLDDAGRAALREVAPEIVMEFRGEHNRKLSTRKEMRWGAKGSFSLAIAGSKEGLWFDHETGRGGDIIEFIKARARLLVCRRARPCGAISYPNCETDISSRPASRPAPRQTVDDDDDEKRITQALGIWCEARPLRGTLAEKYLRSRCIEVPDRGARGSAISSALPVGVGTRPAMVALVRDIITDEPTGIHRTALSADGSKIGRKAARPERRRRDQAVALDRAPAANS